MKKSVLITSPVLLLGGTETYLLALSRCLVRASYNVSILVYHKANPDIVRYFEESGIEVRCLGWPIENVMSGHFRLLMKLSRVFSQASPDIIHIQYLAPGLIPILASRWVNVTMVVATVHQINSYGWKAHWLLRFASRFTDAFFCVSEAVERSWFDNSKIFEPGMSLNDRRHWTIHNPVAVDDNSLINNNPENGPAEVRADGVRTVGVVGRLRGEKGQVVLLEAFARVREGRDKLKLRVVGDGPDRAQLEARAREFGIADCVEWMGSRPPEEVRRLYRAMDVVVVPSLAEGFGLVAAEALAAGRPVVASDVGGLREVIRHEETGLLVPPGDAGALAAAMARILDDPGYAARLAAAGRADVAERFSVARFNARIGEAYRQLLGAPPSVSATP